MITLNLCPFIYICDIYKTKMEAQQGAITTYIDRNELQVLNESSKIYLLNSLITPEWHVMCQLCLYKNIYIFIGK